LACFLTSTFSTATIGRLTFHGGSFAGPSSPSVVEPVVPNMASATIRHSTDRFIMCALKISPPLCIRGGRRSAAPRDRTNGSWNLFRPYDFPIITNWSAVALCAPPPGPPTGPSDSVTALSLLRRKRW
jgi:hypothetical protein